MKTKMEGPIVRGTKTREYVYKSTLRKVYGLTPRMIAECGPADKTRENPYYRNGPDASLYLIERVEAWIEANKERVEKARASRGKRSEAMKTVHDKKRAERLRKEEAWVSGVQITVADPLPDSLLKDAGFISHRDPLEAKGVHAHVRHRLTNYHSLLAELNEREFSGDLYLLLRKRIDAVVTAALVKWKSRKRAD
jgi:hypothetical protein